MRQSWWMGVAALLASTALATSGRAEEAGRGRPRLDLRATPRMAFPPANVFVVAELKGRPSEDFYCPGLEWEWGDGSRSTEESDCPPYEEGARLERFFSARHAFGAPGSYDVKLTMRRAERTLAVARVEVVVQGASTGP